MIEKKARDLANAALDRRAIIDEADHVSRDFVTDIVGAGTARCQRQRRCFVIENC